MPVEGWRRRSRRAAPGWCAAASRRARHRPWRCGPGRDGRSGYQCCRTAKCDASRCPNRSRRTRRVQCRILLMVLHSLTSPDRTEAHRDAGRSLYGRSMARPLTGLSSRPPHRGADPCEGAPGAGPEGCSRRVADPLPPQRRGGCKGYRGRPTASPAVPIRRIDQRGVTPFVDRFRMGAADTMIFADDHYRSVQ